MALHVKTINANGTGVYLGIPLITNSTSSIFSLPANTRRIKVFRNAGIIYEGVSPDEYSVTKSGVYIQFITLNTALTLTEILEIDCFS